jgi:iron complex outermembrane receptor protein
MRAEQMKGTTVGAAVFLILNTAPHRAQAQQADASTNTLQEVTVTANRREQTLEQVPYSMSVISGDQIAKTGVTDIASLSSQVPGLSLYDYGARASGATAPIIRGINATGQPTRAFRSFEQDPVGTYIGNSPVDGYFQLDDLKQIEVLRGPQGTLYGAGALGGALRLIPNSPELGKFSGSLEGSGGRLAHSDGTSYKVDGVLNISLGDTIAFRVSAKYAYDPGFIDAYGLFQRSSNSVSGVPLLANPSDPVNSSPIYGSKQDWNFQRTFTGRASMLWKPTEDFKVEAAVLHSELRGDGGPFVNPTFAGGTSPFDPAATLPAGGRYNEFSQVDQPYSRYTTLASLDLSYDVGFATVSSTTSYHKTSGQLLEDGSYNLAGVGDGGYLPYYAGSPTNPRFVYDQTFADQAHTFTQEIRLVSTPGPDKMFDYTVGLYYEDQTREGKWTIANPGTAERSVAQGCTDAVFYGSAPPVCAVTSGVNDVTFIQDDTQNFQDKSIFGELTYHFLPHAQITGGARYFKQQFTDAQLYEDFAFPTLIPAEPHHSPASKATFKVNPSYEYADHQYVYALWSQGFRRGGANSVPLVGIFQESPQLASYTPDKTNNYEAGLKGRFANGVSYTIAAFDIKWDNPQISSSLPSGNLAVYNGKKAESKGMELDTSGPIAFGLGYALGFSYVDAKLTESFSLPANNGHGVIVDGLISGSAGQQLPGSPKTSATATLTYDTPLAAGYDLNVLLNGAYHSVIVLNLTNSLGTTAVQKSSTYEVFNLSATVNHAPWHVTAYATNLFDRQEILAPPIQPNQVDNLTNDFLVNRPRELGLRAGYSF